jgi:hypothetical protein
LLRGEAAKVVLKEQNETLPGPLGGELETKSFHKIHVNTINDPLLRFFTLVLLDAHTVAASELLRWRVVEAVEVGYSTEYDVGDGVEETEACASTDNTFE